MAGIALGQSGLRGRCQLNRELESALAELPILDILTHLVGGKMAARGLHDILVYHIENPELRLWRWKPHGSLRSSTRWGRCSNCGAKTRSGCGAYHTAAQALVNLPGDLPELIASGGLKEVPGIGDTMYSKIVQLATTGHLPSYDELRRSTPPGLVALLRIPGLGPKKIKALHETLKIESMADLRAAGETGLIAKLKGFGAKTEAKILEGIAFVEKAGERILQSDALRLVAPILAAVRRPSPGHQGRGLRQSPPPGGDNWRP